MKRRISADSFRYIAGAMLLGTHFAAIAILFFADRSTKIEDHIGVILIAIPVTLVYVIAFLKFATQNARSELGAVGGGETYNLLSSLTMFSVISVFSVSLLYISIQYTFFFRFEPQQFKLILGVVETAFGGLLGLIFEMLFGVRISSGDKTAESAKDQLGRVHAGQPDLASTPTLDGQPIASGAIFSEQPAPLRP